MHIHYGQIRYVTFNTRQQMTRINNTVSLMLNMFNVYVNIKTLCCIKYSDEDVHMVLSQQ